MRVIPELTENLDTFEENLQREVVEFRAQEHYSESGNENINVVIVRHGVAPGAAPSTGDCVKREQASPLQAGGERPKVKAYDLRLAASNEKCRSSLYNLIKIKNNMFDILIKLFKHVVF